VLLNLRGGWFAFKEAVLPIILGLIVLGSAWTEQPAARLLFCNPQVLDMVVIEDKLKAFSRQSEFLSLLKRTTMWFSLSFFISASCNFVLALHIFKDIDPSLAASAQDQALNEQIARMTWMGFATIALPLMIFSGILVYAFLRQLSRLTEIPLNSLVKG
jgi:hypothetical protein